MPPPSSDKEHLDRIERHVNDEVPEAINFLGASYLFGNFGLQRNSRRAVRFFRRAARLGNVLALVNLGTALTVAYHDGGTYDEVSVRAIRECYRKLADMGHYEHLFAAYCIQEKNYEEGIRFYLSAAKQGYALAQFYVGHFFDPDPSTYGMEPTHGIAPFLRLPPDGIVSEKCNAGDVFIVPWDYEAQLAEARRWFVRASLNGYPFAKTALESKKKA
jgi:TPR repeat protein